MARIAWRPSYRLVPSRFPPVGLFDRVASPEDLEFVLAAEGLTNDRLRDEVGEIHLVPPAERVSGPGTTPIMAAFTHINREGSRFADGTFGAYYAGKELETSVAESAHHRAIFLASTKEAPGEVDMRVYLADIRGEFVDVRGHGRRKPDIMHPDDYAASQAFARARRAEGANGIVYDSVRNPGGQCVAVFRPRLVAPCRQGPHVCFVWDGAAITGWYRKSGMNTLG
ncbi:MAG TPA: RES family NAD+ phosphorylase [Usitatibacter sp.]|jgi:RES domain-containing protein|nr:RES family NAD+ phosphorylase [Usitatibacter sp.]